MNREKILPILLGGFIGCAVIGLLGYVLAWSPYEDKTAEVAKYEDEVQKKAEKKEAAEVGKKRLAELKRTSLPPEPNTAMREYDFVLTELLNRAGVAAGSRTVNVKLAPDKTHIPLINPGAVAKDKRYAYLKLTADITMSKVDLDTVMKFLTSYEQLGLLHHVAKFNVKVTDTDTGGSAARRGGQVDRVRKDLTVTLTSEAIILDGLEPRESIIKLPKGIEAVGGTAAYYALDTNPQVTRDLLLNRLPRSLPTESYPRTYLSMKLKDPFHGPMPSTPPPPGPYVAPVLPPVDKFIRMSMWTTNSNGTGVADITDMANNITYHIELTRKGEKLHTVISKQRVLEGNVVKFTVNPGVDGDAGKKWVDLPFVISDALGGTPATSSTHRTLTVHGMVMNGLIVSAPTEESAAAPANSGRGGRGGRGGFGGGGGFGAPPTTRSTFTASKKEMAYMAVTSAAFVNDLPKDEKYYIWSVGESLSDVLSTREITRSKLDDVLKNALGPLMPDTTPVAVRDGR
jgi:hypothetical protein